MIPENSAALPDEIPVFPLNGVLLLPSGQLPLNVFERRYLAMVEDVLKSDRIIGMIQPKDPSVIAGQDDTPLFETGCAGKITAFEELDDGQFLITLTGISRFRIAREMPLKNGYRRIEADWSAFAQDRDRQICLDLDRARLKDLLGAYFSLNGLSCDWDAIDDAPDLKLITCLSMICPFGPTEKQALLEAACCRTGAGLFMTMLEMAVQDKGGCTGCH